MKRTILSSFAALLLMLAPAGTAAAQEPTIERLTELCRPQLEAMEREYSIPALQREIDQYSSFAAQYPENVSVESRQELRYFETQLADIRANGLNAAGVRDIVDQYRESNDDELRELLGHLADTDGPHVASDICLVEARLAARGGIPQRNALRNGGATGQGPLGLTVDKVPPSQAEQGPLGLRDKSPASTGLAAPTSEERYFLRLRVINTDAEECDQDCPHLGGELLLYRSDRDIWQPLLAAFSNDHHLGDPLPAGTVWEIRFDPSFDHYDCEVPGGGSVPADERAINIAGAIHVGDVTCKLTPNGREEFVRIRTRRETPISNKSVPVPER